MKIKSNKSVCEDDILLFPELDIKNLKMDLSENRVLVSGKL